MGVTRSAVVFGGAPANPMAVSVPGSSPWQTVRVDGFTLACGLVPTTPPTFDPGAPAHATSVLVRVRAVSCNYRDRSILRLMEHVPAGRFSGVGSEFAGDVIAVGKDVRTLRVGDRVIANSHYTGRTRAPSEPREGIVTNQASRAVHVFQAAQLLPIPDAMSDEVAAGFSLGAQTAYGMVRRLGVRPGTKVLVTAGRSSTSLFVIAALRQHPVSVYVTTSAMADEQALRRLGATDVIHLPRDGGAAESDPLVAAAADVGGFDYVIDPFFDLHVYRAVAVMNPFGSYITCGLATQNAGSARPPAPLPPLDVILHAAMIRNLALLGNCIGLGSDLEQAINDFAGGRLSTVIDSVYTGDAVGAFLDRTYNDRTRFGKVVFRYDN